MNEEKFTHPEWKVENSLTAPSDRDPSRTYKPNQGYRQLSEKEVEHAMEELNDNNYIRKFLRVERRYADPVDPMQRVGLISFVPAKGSTPNDKGIYGFAKLRGNYPTDTEANERAETLIRTTDSYHKIFHAYVGRPFPLTTSSDFSGETKEIDIRKSMSESISNSIKSKKKEESQVVKEIENREKELLEESKKEEDPLDHYTTLRVKKAQITWTYLETEKKLEEMKDIIIKTREEISAMEAEDESYSKNYYKKYCDAREGAGLNNSSNQDTFMKFLVEDHEFDW